MQFLHFDSSTFQTFCNSIIIQYRPKEKYRVVAIKSLEKINFMQLLILRFGGQVFLCSRTLWCPKESQLWCQHFFHNKQTNKPRFREAGCGVGQEFYHDHHLVYQKHPNDTQTKRTEVKKLKTKCFWGWPRCDMTCYFTNACMYTSIEHHSTHVIRETIPHLF